MAAAYGSMLLPNNNNTSKTVAARRLTILYSSSSSSSSSRSPAVSVAFPTTTINKNITTFHQSLDIRAKVLSSEEGSQIQRDTDTTGGIGGGDIGDKGGSGGGGGGNEEGDSENSNKKKMSMSQKLTLGYAALVGLGGVMGYVKSGSQKSLAAGGISSLLLYYVYTQLPVRPALASSLGFGLSAALLVVMGSRFKKSGKVFPAGVVSFVSLVMTGGYLHGIMRGMH